MKSPAATWSGCPNAARVAPAASERQTENGALLWSVAVKPTADTTTRTLDELTSGTCQTKLPSLAVGFASAPVASWGGPPSTVYWICTWAEPMFALLQVTAIGSKPCSVSPPFGPSTVTAAAITWPSLPRRCVA